MVDGMPEHVQESLSASIPFPSRLGKPEEIAATVAFLCSDDAAFITGANIAVTPSADEVFFDRGILSIPDFIANAGGVICGAVEYHGGTATQAFQVIEEKIRANTREVLDSARASNVMPSIAAAELAKRRVRESMGYRRGF